MYFAMFRTFLKKYVWPYSLKNRLISMFLICSLLPIILLGSISFNSVMSIIQNKLQIEIKDNLKQVEFLFENMLENMNHVSQQLAFEGGVGKDLLQYMRTESLYQKKQIADDIHEQMNLIEFTNPNVGLIFYYYTDQERPLFSTMGIVEEFTVNELPLLSELNNITYYGPHKTISQNNDYQVISLTRKVNMPEIKNLNLYIETDFKKVHQIMDKKDSIMKMELLITNENDQVTFSSNTTDFPYNSKLVLDSSKENYTINHTNYYIFSGHSQRNWRIMAAIKASDYKKEIDTWLAQFTLIAIFSIVISLMMALLFWRIVYNPLKNFNKELKLINDDNYKHALKYPKVKEIDSYLVQIDQMRGHILQLLDDVKQETRRSAYLETEKLMVQINPHFIHNTLDTIKWMARLNGQEDIDQTISSLNKLLYYNLGKGGKSILNDEINAVRNYVFLQKMKYDFSFHLIIHADDEILETPVPRFILQPLVENAIYHGLAGNGGNIYLDLCMGENDSILITVSDDGIGMNKDKIASVMDIKSGMGIGINYVINILQHIFGENAKLKIDSKEGQGTKITLKIPIKPGGENDSCTCGG